MAFLVWGLLACGSVFWLIQLLGKPLQTPVHALAAAESVSGRADMTRLFGAPNVGTPEPVVVAEIRFKLIGVVAARTARAQQAGEGVALISVDGVSRTVRVGAWVDTELRLLAVDARSASLGQGGVVSLTLQIAPPLDASTGALAPAAPSPLVLGGVGLQVPPRPLTPASAPGGMRAFPERPPVNPGE